MSGGSGGGKTADPRRPESVTAGVGIRHAVISPDGTKLAYAKSRIVANLWRAPSWKIGWDCIGKNGRYLVYTSNESGHIEVFGDTFPDRSNKIQISNEGGTEPVWSWDGKELFYRYEYAMMGVSVTTDPEFAKPFLLFERN